MITSSFSQPLASQTTTAIRTIILLPEVDTYVDPANPTTSFSGQQLVVSAEQNKSQKVAYVRFDLGPIPPTATITGCQFYFTVDGEVTKQVVKLLLVDNDIWMDSITFNTAPKPTTTAIGTWEAEIGQRVTTNAINPVLIDVVQKKLSAGPVRKISIQASSTFGQEGGAVANTYWSSEQTSATNYASRPRLVVQYKPEEEPLARDWGQHQADAQHSGRSPWVFANTPTSSYLPDTVKSGIQLSSSAVIRNERLYLFTPNQLQVLDPDGGVLRPIASGLAEFISLALGPNGLLYAAGKSELAAFDLEGGGMKSISIPLTDLSSQITAGADGSVYLAQGSTLFAYVHWAGKLIPAWTKELGTETVSQVTLNADGSVAYIAAADKLYALYTADGSEKWSFPLPSRASHLATPVAGRANNVSYFAVDKKLYIFKDSKQPMIPELGADLISQPVGWNDTLYVLQGTRLYSVGSDGTVQSSVDIPGITATSTVEPVMDGAGNLFIVDNENKLFIYQQNLEPPGGFSPQALPFTGSLGVLQVAPNGFIFCNSASALFRLKPSVESTVKISSYSDATSYRAGTLLVLAGSALPAAASVIFQSGGTITIEPGFSVPLGTEVVLRTGS